MVKKTTGAFALALILAACGPGEESDNTLVIGDRFFVTQIMDIFMNPRIHVGRTIQYEGLFRTLVWVTGNDNFAVIRYTIGCCGEEPIGLRILLPDGMEPFANDAWVRVTGILERSNGSPVVRATSIVETAERGASFVDPR